jgi:hypothetical protein
MNEFQRQATHVFTEKALDIVASGPEVMGACIIVLQKTEDGGETTICMRFPTAFRARLPEMFRDIALTVEKENLMAGVKTEPLGKVETEILKSVTRPA